MIDISKISDEKPLVRFIKEYKKAHSLEQPNIDAISISSFDNKSGEPDSRYVNLKYIIDNKWIFFSNYNSLKAKQFESVNKIAASFFWHKTNCQIRMKSTIRKTKPKFSDDHFRLRNKSKNLLAIVSDQSNFVNSYNDFLLKYKKYKNENIDLTLRPDYWGGFTFIPYYFEFWNGDANRLNKRECFYISGDEWKSSFLQP